MNKLYCIPLLLLLILVSPFVAMYYIGEMICNNAYEYIEWLHEKMNE